MGQSSLDLDVDRSFCLSLLSYKFFRQRIHDNRLPISAKWRQFLRFLVNFEGLARILIMDKLR